MADIQSWMRMYDVMVCCEIVKFGGKFEHFHVLKFEHVFVEITD